MRPKDIDRFFRLLSKEIDFPVEIILTGGAVPVLEGSHRVTRDLDFQIAFRKTSTDRQDHVGAALRRVTQMTGIATQYDEAIEHWGMISWPRRPLKTHLYKRFGTLSIYLLNPLLWSIGKLSRYLSSDVDDVTFLFKKLKVSPLSAARAWGEALGQSPMSSAQPLFKQQVLHFLREHGEVVWGKALDLAKLETVFINEARRSQQRKRHLRG